LETVPVFAYFVGTWESAHFEGWYYGCQGLVGN